MTDEKFIPIEIRLRRAMAELTTELNRHLEESATKRIARADILKTMAKVLGRLPASREKGALEELWQELAKANG